MIIYRLSELKSIFKKHHPSDMAVVTSKKILRMSPWVLEEIKNATQAPVRTIYIQDGEGAKDFKEFEKLLRLFVKNHLTRGSIVIAVGGGSVGDVTGFAASVYMRGISYIQLPTTLLACVDSSIGGKVAANFAGYKNNIGMTRLPLATCIDERFLLSLPRNQWVNGLAEVIKAGLIVDPQILRTLIKGFEDIKNNPSLLRTLIRRSIRVKEKIVQIDPFEKNVRRLLNFGHTIGHAVELRNNMSHGMAVLCGMRTELLIQKELGLEYIEPLNILDAFLIQYAIRFPTNIKIDYESLYHDKKTEGDMLWLPVVERVGHGRVISVSLKKYSALIKKSLKDFNS